MPTGKNILLIWPGRDKSFYDFDPIRIITGQRSLFFPLPLIYVAAALGDTWNYTLVDEDITPPTPAQLEGADFFMISVNLLQRYATDRLIARLVPFGKPIIIGGPLVSTLDHLFNHPNISKVFGEIEAVESSCIDKQLSVAEVLSSDMKAGTLRREYHAKGHPDLSKNRTPRYDLVRNSDYFSLSMQTSRGCPHHCDFCQQIILYGKHRRKTAAQVTAELDELLKIKQNVTVIIIDDNLMGEVANPEKKQEFLNLLDTMREWQELHNYPFDFFTQCSLDIAEHQDVIAAMAKIGLNIMFIGIESVDDEALASVHKKQNLERNMIDNIRTLQQHGMGVFAGVIIGFDNESDATIRKQIEFLEKSHIPLVGPSLLHAAPGTRMYKDMKAKNRISSDPDALTKEFRSNIISLQPPKEYYRLFARYLDNVYAPERYFRRCLLWIEGWNDAYVIPGKKGSIPSNVKIKRIVRSLFYQGIVASYRFHFLMYLAAALIKFRRNPDKISLALYLGYMFQIAYTSTKNAQQFIRNIPQDISTEWHQFNQKCQSHE